MRKGRPTSVGCGGMRTGAYVLWRSRMELGKGCREEDK